MSSPPAARPAGAAADTLSTTDKWRADHERRAARAAVDQQYFDMMPRGVQLRANMIRAGLST